MKKHILILIFTCLTLLLSSCNKEKSAPINGEGFLEKEFQKKNYQVFIVMDTIDDWSSKTKDGFINTLNNILEKKGEKSDFFIFDTELKTEKALSILDEIYKKNPDLICTINYPNSFADINISLKLRDSQYKIVSMNPVALEAGIIKSYEHPDNNITGVGVFLQMNSLLRLMKKINPNTKKLAYFSWDIMTLVNNMLEKEIRRASIEENIELVEFLRVPHVEAVFDFYDKYEVLNTKDEYFIMGGISPFVHKDGSASDDKDFTKWLRENTSIPSLSYEETDIEYGVLAGASVIWSDIGSQLAEKANLILTGTNPGDIPWSYPRSYNLIINKKRSDKLNLNIPEEILGAAYRIYTDYNGHYIGQE